MYDKCINIFYVILEKDKLNYICVDYDGFFGCRFFILLGRFFLLLLLVFCLFFLVKRGGFSL